MITAVPPGRYDWLDVDVDVAAPTAAIVWLHYAGGIDPEDLIVDAIGRSTVRVPVTRRDTLAAVHLPESVPTTGIRLRGPGGEVAPS